MTRHRDPSGTPELDPALLEEAIRLATEKHAGQLRKADGQPYLTHPVAVALLCARAGLESTTIAAALLHDVLEDTRTTPEEMAGVVGWDVTRIVQDVTKSDERLPWSAKAAAYARRLRSAGREALAVAAADKIHNLYAMDRAYEEQGAAVDGHFHSSFEERVRSYVEVRDLIRERWPECPLLPELDRQLERSRRDLG